MIVLGSRSKGQPAPPHVILEALVDPHHDATRQWLALLYDEVEPQVVHIKGASVVVWSSIWSKRPQAQVRFDVQGGPEGSELRWTLHDVEDPGPALTGHMCKRLNELINRDLRYTFGQ